MEKQASSEASSPQGPDHKSVSPSGTSSRVSSTRSSISLSPATEETVNQPPWPLSVEDRLASLSVEEEPERMFRSIALVVRNAQGQEGGIELNQADLKALGETLRHANDSEAQGVPDAAGLGATKELLEGMLQKESRFLLDVARVLADKSRDPVWRVPFAEAGILKFFLRVIATKNATEDLLIQALRLVGNSCADNDMNRQLVVDDNDLALIIQQLEKPRLVLTAIPVLYNICADFEPAQTLAQACKLYSKLLFVLEKGWCTSAAIMSYLCRLLDFLVESVTAADSPDEAVETLFQAALSHDLDPDDLGSLVDVAVTHLKLERYQIHMIEKNLVDVPVRLLLRLYSQLPGLELSYPLGGDHIPPIRDAEEENGLSMVRGNIIHALSDISSLPQFAAKYAGLKSSLTDALLKWLSASQPQLQLCSCIMLGNLARSDPVCQLMISECKLHVKLINILKTSSDTSVLHSVLSFLRNLGLLPQNKQTIGESGIVLALARFWTVETMPQITHAAASLTRQLINRCTDNISRLLAPLSADEESPAYSRTYLSLIVSLFEKSDDLPLKVEIARIVAAMFRTIYTSDASTPSNFRDITLHRLYSLHPNIGRPLAAMVSQTQWRVMRSEGWFAMALAARTEEGSLAMDAVLEVDVLDALEKTICGTLGRTLAGPSRPVAVDEQIELEAAVTHTPDSGVENGAELNAKDRENAMVLVNELLKNRSGQMHELRRSFLEDLLRGKG